MPALTPSFLFKFEENLRLIQEQSYASLAASENQWWGDFTRVIPSGASKEHLIWILDTMEIEGRGPKGGSMDFQDISMLETDFEAEFANSGLKLLRSQMEDTDGKGLELGSAWVRQATLKGAYWPQKQIANLIINGTGTTRLAYDRLSFFNAAHPYNPKNSSAGTFSNIITSVGIAGSSDATDFAHLQTVASTIAQIKQANGVDPRHLQPRSILASSILYPRIAKLLDAKFIGGTVGSTDISGHLQSLGFGRVVHAPELNALNSGNTYIVMAGAPGVPVNELSAGFAYIERQPFGINYYTGSGGGDAYVDAILNRANEIEYHIQGRNVAGYGHPFACFACSES